MNRTTRVGLFGVLFLAAAGVVRGQSDVPGLVAAGPTNWALLTLNGNLQCERSSVTGNVGVVGNVNWDGQCSDTGDIVFTGTFKGNGLVTGQARQDAADLGAAHDNAVGVSAYLAALPCTGPAVLLSQCGRAIKGSISLLGGYGPNILNVPSISFPGQASQIAICAPIDSTFVINVSESWQAGSAPSNIRLVDGCGISPQNVVINYLGTKPVKIGSGGSVLQAIVLAPHAAFNLNGGSASPEVIAQSIALGRVAETGYVQVAADSFDGSPAPNWTDFCESPLDFSGGFAVDPDGNFSCGYRTASFANNQYSQAQIPQTAGGLHQLIVRASGTDLYNRQYYQLYWSQGGILQFGFFAQNSTYPGKLYRDIGAPVLTAPPAPGDIFMFEVTGTTLNAYINGALLNSASVLGLTDGSGNPVAPLTSGSPGFLLYSLASFSSWVGGNLP